VSESKCPETSTEYSTYYSTSPCPETKSYTKYVQYTTVVPYTTSKCATSTGWTTWKAQQTGWGKN
jgi:hypothetical protein